MNKAVFIDAGHGGIDPGCPLGLKEKEYNLRVAKTLASMLQARGYKVEMARRDDRSMSLKQRCQMANGFYQGNGGIFVSIHHNAANNPTAQGFEVYHCKGSRMGLALANAVTDGFKTYLWEWWQANRGVKEDSYYVLLHTKAPAVLVECEFLTGPQLVSMKRDPSLWVCHCAKAITRGIEVFYRGE